MDPLLESAGLPDPLADVPIEELRLALVLNGGVSLAVWMGGVAHEINRLTRSGVGTGPYGAVLGLVRSEASVDVISGTSAGGINGAALALAQANLDADLLSLRDLWGEQGRLENLLRTPFRGQPTSLLRGDDYFLPALHRAMRGLTRDFRASGRSVDLTITTTLLNGSRRVTSDAFGQSLPQRLHASRFRFRSPELGSDAPDPFTAEAIDATAEAMALAARCTAGFPFAFEPTFVPVSGRLDTERDPADDRPDMTPYAEWVDEGFEGDRVRDRSRFAVDGGVLANTPTREALEAIDRRGAGRPLRRAMLLVYPHAPTDALDPPDLRAEVPTVVETATGLLGALTSQGSLTFVDEIEAHNREASRWRGGRSQVLQSSSVADLYHLVEVVWPHYVALRRRDSARSLADRSRPRAQWSYQRVRDAAEVAQNSLDPLPYVPHHPPPHPGAHEGPGWNWGPGVAFGVADAVAEMLRAALSVATSAENGALCRAREKVSMARDEIFKAQDEIDDIWDSDERLRRRNPDENYWTARLVSYRRAMLPGQDADRDRATLQRLLGLDPALPDPAAMTRILGRNGEQGVAIRQAVLRMTAALAEVSPLLLSIARTRRGGLARLTPWVPVLDEAPVPAPSVDADWAESLDPALRLLQRLLALEVATWLVADGQSTGTSLPVDLVQLSLAGEHRFAVHSDTPQAKVAGLELHRFGGFLKRSWRMNDWIWGRLDAAALLCRVALDPRRLRRMGAMLDRDPDDAAEELVARLETQLYDGADPPTDASYARLRKGAVAELTAVLGPDASETLGHLPRLAELAAYPLQMRIILEELPVLAGAIRADRIDGANPRSRGERFLVEEERLLSRLPVAPGDPEWPRLGAEALAAFDRAGVGRESLAAEAGSDAMVRTAATTAAVLTTVVDSENLGVRALRPVTRVMRGAVQLPYWLVKGLTAGTGAARALAQFGFLLGGVVLALSLLGLLGPLSGAGAAIGTATLLAAFGYSALRSGTLLHGVVLLGPVVPLVAFAFGAQVEDSAVQDALRAVLLVVAIAVGLGLLASLPNPLFSPLRTLQGGSRTTSREDGLPVLLLLAVGAGLLALGWVWRDELRLLLSERVGVVWAVVASLVVALVGGFTAYRLGRGLRVWRRSPDGTTYVRERAVTHAGGVAVGWSTVYGAVYLVLAWLIGVASAWSTDDAEEVASWVVATTVWCAVLGAGLLLGGPWLLSRGPRQKLVRELPVDIARLRDHDRAKDAADRRSRTDLLWDALDGRDELYVSLFGGVREPTWSGKQLRDRVAPPPAMVPVRHDPPPAPPQPESPPHP